MAGGAHRLPIFQDDLTFQDRHSKSFRDIQSRMDQDLGQAGFGRGGTWSRWNWEDDLDRMCGDFFKLKPSSTGRRDELKREKDFGSRDSLEDHTTYVENPQTKSRTFHMSFDVKEYSPHEISVKADGDTLMVEARHTDEVGDHQNVREFSRSVKIPKDVEADKLTSTLSNDGILTVQAPVPPKYTSVAYINPQAPQPQTHNGTGTGIQYKPPPLLQQTQQQPIQNQPRPQPPKYDNYAQYSQSPPPPTPQQAQYIQQPQARPSPPPPPAPQHGTTQPPPMPSQTSWPAPPPAPQHGTTQPPPMPSQTSWPAPPPPHQYEPSQLISRSPPPLFEQPPPPPMPLDTPYFRNGANGGPREMELAIEVPRPFTPDDVVVKLEGKSLNVEATHEENVHGKTSKSSMSRSFDLEEELDPASVEAMLRSDGCLLIKGVVAAKD